MNNPYDAPHTSDIPPRVEQPVIPVETLIELAKAYGITVKVHGTEPEDECLIVREHGILGRITQPAPHGSLRCMLRTTVYHQRKRNARYRETLPWIDGDIIEEKVE